MKKFIRILLSLLLIAASVFGLVAGVNGVQDAMNIKDYKTIDGQTAEDGLATARDGIAQLRENEQTYIDGVATYEDGVVTLAEGEQTLADGYAQYNAGKQQLADGYAQYNEGKQALAEGQATIDANTDAYNEGKEALSKIEPLMPYLEQYIAFRDGSLANLPGFDTAEAWFTAVVRPLAANLGLEIPADVTDFPQWMSDYVAAGQAKLKEYEDGLVALEEGKQQLADAEGQLADGEAQLADAEGQLADGEAQLADGRQQLADGDAQLTVYEDGERQLVDGMYQLLEGMSETDRVNSGEKVVPGLLELLGGSFDPYQHDENGNVVTYRGNQHVDLDACEALCDKGQEYLDLSGVATTREVVSRLAGYALLLLGSLFGLLGGIFGITSAFSGGRKTGFVSGLLSTILAACGVVIGIVFKYNDLTCAVKLADGSYEWRGGQQFTALILLACAALLFTIFAKIFRNKVKKAGKGSKKSGKSSGGKTEDDIYREAAMNAGKDEEIARLRDEVSQLKGEKPATYKS